jgi:uncharacterized caspase-like protein
MSIAHHGSDRRIQRRLALVIGVWDYNRNQDLRNPGHDADDMASTLTSSGYLVTKGLNSTSAKMHSMIADFVREIRPSDLVLFYFSGHGTQWHVRTAFDTKIKSVRFFIGSELFNSIG